MVLTWSWAALCDDCWWIMIEVAWKHHPNTQIIRLFIYPCFPILAVGRLFCGWVTADVRAKQQYGENLLIHDLKKTKKKQQQQKNTRLHAKIHCKTFFQPNSLKHHKV